MKAIMTVTGADHTGIIAAVANTLAAHEVNILNVSQTLMDGYFTMIMQLEFDADTTPLSTLQAAMSEVERTQQLDIKVQAEAIFNVMHSL